jgi:ACS family allantoate permease-like MFS transporter
MIITGSITVVTAVLYWFFFPDSPTNAWFLTPEERVKAVLRTKENQTGVENKTFKKEQMIEALKDPKTWLFALYAALIDVPNSLLNQRTIIVTSFGWTPLQTTLLGCVDGVIEIITIFVGVQVRETDDRRYTFKLTVFKLAARIPNSRAYIVTLCVVPSVIGCLLVTLLPWRNKVGLLCALWTIDICFSGFVIILSWVTSTTAGHTKRITTNAILLIAYCVGNAVGPLMWQAKYAPRNYVPWGVIGGCFFVCGTIPPVLRWILARENALRDKEGHDSTYDDVYTDQLTPEGKKVEVRVPKVRPPIPLHLRRPI